MDDELPSLTPPVPASVPVSKVGQEQIQDLLFGEQLSWQAIIYDLVNSEQLDPWDINLSLLSERFLERVRALEEANFFVSSKVLLAASLLLRMKSELLLSNDIESLDAILFGRKPEKSYAQERITLDEEIPGLVARTPLPRSRKVSLEELMSALGHAIKTENRRIQRVIVARQQEYETSLSLPKRRLHVGDAIHTVHGKLEQHFASSSEKLAFSSIAGTTKDDRVATFVPLLHLDNQQKVWLEQEGHIGEIWILLKHLYEAHNKEALAKAAQEVDEALKEEGIVETPSEDTGDDEEETIEEVIVNEFKQPLSESFDDALSPSSL
jgi:segregation and condensation protein A